MLEARTIRIDLPKSIFNESKVLIKEGLFSNFSELVKVSIENNLLLHLHLIKNKESLYEWFKEDEIWKDILNMNQKEIVEKIKKIRYNKVFKEINN